MIHVIAVLTAKPGQREKILLAFKANAPTVRAEHGCVEYVATIDAEGAPAMQTAYGPDTFVVVEKWDDMAALAAHAAAPHMAAYGARTKDMIASRVIHVLDPVQGQA
ncbi:MAG: antibiotic biosynthesis monooxygenase family protein [Lautropia sp.]